MVVLGGKVMRRESGFCLVGFGSSLEGSQVRKVNQIRRCRCDCEDLFFTDRKSVV